MFAAIAELRPLSWWEVLRQGLWVWPLLLVVRARRRGWDLVECGSCLAFTALAITSRRNIAAYAVIAAPFVARDLPSLQPLLAALRGPGAAWPVAARAALTAALSILMCIPAWSNPLLPLGIGMRPRSIPQRFVDQPRGKCIRRRPEI